MDFRPIVSASQKTNEYIHWSQCQHSSCLSVSSCHWPLPGICSFIPMILVKIIFFSVMSHGNSAAFCSILFYCIIWRKRIVFAAIKSSSPPVVFSSSSCICKRCNILESSAKSIYLLTSILTFGSFYGLHLIISIIVRSRVASSKPGLSVKCTEQMLRDFRSLLQRWIITCDGKFVLVKSRCYNLLFSFRILVKSVVTN